MEISGAIDFVQSQYVSVGGFLKWGYPEIIHFNWSFHDKPSSYWGTIDGNWLDGPCVNCQVMQTSSGSRPNPSKQSLQRVVACDASKAVAANVTGELLQLACESQLVEKGGGATMRKNMGLVYRSTFCSTSCVNMSIQ